jgi:hypothetical protein
MSDSVVNIIVRSTTLASAGYKELSQVVLVMDGREFPLGTPAPGDKEDALLEFTEALSELLPRTR